MWVLHLQEITPLANFLPTKRHYQDKARPLSAGSFFAFSPGMVHFAYTDEETVVQVSSTGPWGLRYVNPQDDPRQKTQ
jgi:hypothetical protein